MVDRCRMATTVAVRETRAGRLTLGVLAGLILLLPIPRAIAQFGSPSPSDLSDVVQVDEADSAARTLLERAKAHAAEKQWDEAIETLRQVMERDGGKLIRLDPRHFVTMREYCQMRLAELPPEGRAEYRSRVDSLAKRWYQRGIADRDEKMLGRVVDQFFISSSGDTALLALGEMALERGDYQEARWCWERISPELRAPDGGPLWLSLRTSQPEASERRKRGDERPATKTDAAKTDAAKTDAAKTDAARTNAAPSPHWLAYPDTKLNLADVRARLVLVSIMEGASPRANVELADFVRRHPDAKGRMAGRDAPYADTLSRLLAAAQSRPPAAPTKDWTTFAGSPERTAIAAEPKSPRNFLWQIPLGDGRVFKADTNTLENLRRSNHWPMPTFRTADDHSALLSFHPLVAGNLVLFNTVDKVFAFDLRTGKPAWPIKSSQPDASIREPGEFYCGLKDQDRPTDQNGEGSFFQAFGAPRFTMTVVGDRLYARLGSPITGYPPGAMALGGGSNYLVCLDISAQGLLTWRVPGEKLQDERWSYEGAPVADGNNVYIVMRYSDVRPQVHVACLDARTGALRWRKLICTNDSVAGAQFAEITANLLTLADHTLYLNTNLGAVAALSAADGEIRWISNYPRAKSREENAAHFYRDLNPCVYSRGNLFVLPNDAANIFALDASTGQLLWESPHFPETMHLIGVGGNNLIASGKRICWFDVDSGKAVGSLMDDTARGYGRGVLVGDQVYWPMRTQIRRYKQRIPENGYLDADEPIQLESFDQTLTGGNLVAANGYLLIATPTKLIAFGPGKPTASPDEQILTQNTTMPIDTTRHRD